MRKCISGSGIDDGCNHVNLEKKIFVLELQILLQVFFIDSFGSLQILLQQILLHYG